jgi:hypothetical protein
MLDSLLEPKDGHALWQEMITAWAVSPEQQAYWRNFGLEYKGSSDDEEAMKKAGQKVIEFLRNNVGGPENAPYWLPTVAKDGTEFRILVGKNGNNGQFDIVAPLKNQLKEARKNGDSEAIKNLGVYLDRIPFTAFSLKEWQEDSSKHDYFDRILKDNWRTKGATLMDADPDKIPYNFWGLLYDQNRFMFVAGHQKPVTFEAAWTDDAKKYSFGGPEGVFRKDIDPLIATTDWQIYTRLTSIWDENPHPVKPGGPIAARGDQARYICAVWYIACKPIVDVRILSPEDSLFQPIQ